MKFKTFNDYVDQVSEKFPTIPKKSIQRILEFGSRSFYAHTYYGCDILLKTKYFTMYCGRIFSNNLDFYKYWLIKHRIKLRFKYARSKPQYTGYYYLGMTEQEYHNYKKQLTSKTKRRKKLTFHDVYLFKILDEAVLYRHYKHFFKIAVKNESTFKFYLDELTTRDYEYLGQRDGDQSIAFINYEARNN